MNVAAILKHKGQQVFTSSPAATLSEIAHILNANKVGSVVIVDDDNRVVGIVSERDIIRAIAEKSASALEQPVEVCMTCEVASCSLDDTLEKLMSEMTARRFRHLPVVEQGRLVGLVAIGDVGKQRIAETEMEAAALRDYITTG